MSTTSTTSTLRHIDDDEFEPCHGLPELLPAGEKMLWQGSPTPRAVAHRIFHLPALAIYFGLLLAWRGISLAADGAAGIDIVKSVALLTGLAALALATLAIISWCVSRTTVYTVTDQRVVMRIGMVLSVTFNLPYARIEAAGLRLHADGTGDIPLRLCVPNRIGLIHLWPHARPWQFTRTQPMLRAIPDAARVAALMSAAMAESAGVPVQTAAHTPVGTPVRAADAAGVRDRRPVPAEVGRVMAA